MNHASVMMEPNCSESRALDARAVSQAKNKPEPIKNQSNHRPPSHILNVIPCLFTISTISYLVLGAKINFTDSVWRGFYHDRLCPGNKLR